MMTYREIWLKAAEIFAIHRNETARYVPNSLGNVFASSDRDADWRQVIATVDFITGTSLR